MRTILYFVRHAESLFIEGMERTRGLSLKGKQDADRVYDIMKNIPIDEFISSPYQRSIETIQKLAEMRSKEIFTYEDLRERSIGNFDSLEFKSAKRRVYMEKAFSFENGESSIEAQARAMKVLKQILQENMGKTIVIGTHGDIMTLMMNAFEPKYDYDFWESLTMPDIYRLEFALEQLVDVKRIWSVG